MNYNASKVNSHSFRIRSFMALLGQSQVDCDTSSAGLSLLAPYIPVHYQRNSISYLVARYSCQKVGLRVDILAIDSQNDVSHAYRPLTTATVIPL